MKAIGYAGANLYRCKYGPYKIVICAPDKSTATEAFVLFLNGRGYQDTIYSNKLNIKATNSVNRKAGEPLYWAQVDVTS